MRKGLIALVVILAAGCTEVPEPIPYDYTKIFTGESRKGWSIRSYSYTESGKATQTGSLDDCLEDDIYIFYANTERTMQVVNGNKKCEDSEPDMIAEGVWSFANANATLSMPFPLLADGFPLPFILREAEEDRMTIEIFFNDSKSSYRFNFREADLE